MHQLPKIRDDNDDLSTDCCPKPGGAKELHKYCRTLPQRPVNFQTDDVLLDEDGIPILDEQTGTTIFDDWRF